MIQHNTIADTFTCDKCKKTITIKNWREAIADGWAVPTDEPFQWCRECTEQHTTELIVSVRAHGTKEP